MPDSSLPPTASSSSTSPPRAASGNLPALVTELWELVVAYAKQETVGPLKGLRQFLAWGVGGTVLTTFGLILLTLGGLRALQTETTLDGHLSWLPYVLVVVLAAGVIGLAVRAIIKPVRQKER
jgi:hypothetical protein